MAERQNYRVDQAGAVLNWWATIFHNTPLRMGWALNGRMPFLTPFQDLLDTGVLLTYFFIFNNSRGS